MNLAGRGETEFWPWRLEKAFPVLNHLSLVKRFGKSSPAYVRASQSTPRGIRMHPGEIWLRIISSTANVTSKAMKKYLLILIAALFCIGDGLPTQSAAEARTVVVLNRGHWRHHHYRHYVSHRHVYRTGYWTCRHGNRYWIPGRYVVAAV